MFSGNFKFILLLLSIIGVFAILSKLKYIILFVSWSVIIFCLGILFIKANSNNKVLQAKIDYYFRLFMQSRFVHYMLVLREKILSKLNDEKK